MSSRAFEDEKGKIWIVTKKGSSLKVSGQRGMQDTLQEIAHSCARKLGITHTRSGVPLEHVNQHRRIWNALWSSGRPAS
jgi:hypothetical protein